MVTEDTFYDLDLGKNKAKFSIRNIDVSIVNSIRRTIQSNVKNIAFFFDAKSINNPDIEIIQNDSPLHNEFLAQRLSMIPIHFEKKIIDNWNRDDYSFVIDEKNNSNKFMDITSKHIKVYKNNEEYTDREKIFPPFTPKGTTEKHYILITKLPPETTKSSPAIKINLKASIGSGHQHSCFSPTSLCTYMNKIVEGDALKDAEEAFVDKYIKQYETVFLEELKDQNPDEVDTKTTIERDKKYYKINEIERDKVKQQGQLKFNTLDKQREYLKNDEGEPNNFIFKLESECALMPSDIFSEAIQYLLSRIDKVINSNLVIKELSENHYEIMIHDESHTIGNLIQALIYNEFIRKQKAEQVSFIGYFVTHPLENTVCMKLTSTLKKDELLIFFKENALGHVKKLLQNLDKQWLSEVNAFFLNTI